MRDSYVLITAAKNEEAYIPRLLESVVSQTRLPETWVIVSDGSTDRTDELVVEFSRQYDFIRLLKLANQGQRVFSSQAFASNLGYDSIKHSDFDFVGFLDADISFDAGYYKKLLSIFRANPQLGVAGGEIFERQGGGFQPRFGNSEENVAGAIQLFRRRCFEDIGCRFIPLQHGGHDFVANAMARKEGWEVRSITGLPVYHHRPTGSVGTTQWRAWFRTGLQDYFMGYHALFEIGKCIRRVSSPPVGIGTVAQFCGYVFPWVTRRKRSVPDDFVQYLHQEQLRRVFPRAARPVEGNERPRKSA